MKQFPDVASARGAPMGRPEYGNPTDAPSHLFKVNMVDGDYDDGGAYHGGLPSKPLWCLRSDASEHFARAPNRLAALAEFRKRWPDLLIEPPTTEEQLDIITEHYIIAALWADAQEGTNPKVPNAERAAVREVCARFVQQCEDAGNLFTLAMGRGDFGYGSHPDAGSPEAAFGHDFYLTRQGHGTGFWDRKELKLPANGGRSLSDLLSEEAKKVGECYHNQYKGWFYFNEK